MPEVEAFAVAPVGTADLAYLTAHTTAVVKAQKPRLMAAKQNHYKTAPVCTVAPAVTGTVTVGQVQTCSTGTWLNSPAFTYSWKRRDGAAIPSATAATYTLQAADSGYQVECEVTGTNSFGAMTARSNRVIVP